MVASNAESANLLSTSNNANAIWASGSQVTSYYDLVSYAVEVNCSEQLVEFIHTSVNVTNDKDAGLGCDWVVAAICNQFCQIRVRRYMIRFAGRTSISIFLMGYSPLLLKEKKRITVSVS